MQANCSCQMYSVEDLLNTRGKGSVTSGPRIWVKKHRANTKLCKLKNLLIEKKLGEEMLLESGKLFMKDYQGRTQCPNLFTSIVM